MTYPTRKEAQALLAWGEAQNPGPWINHCQATAYAAETIASHCGMDPEQAYVSGLLHDIGYYANADGTGKTCHVYAGYILMKEKGYDPIAEICLTHSFPIQDINTYSGLTLATHPQERAILESELSSIAYNDYHKLIQLCDCIGTAPICIIEQRFVDVTLRHGFNAHTLEKWKAYYTVKDYFEKKCGENIYNFFRDEINKRIFT